MSLDHKGQRYCDHCGRSMVNAHRIYKGNEYCSSCYANVFVPMPCTRCGKRARVHRHTTAAVVCRQCDRETRRCLRCDRPVWKAARLVDERPVCGGCVPYFLEPELCAWCGMSTVHLSRAPRVGIDEKICNSCRNKLTHKSCAVCRRYRPVAGLLPTGKAHCQACTPGVEQSHPCPSCGEVLAGNGKGKCTTCLNAERIEHDAAVQALALERDWARIAYVTFGQWLLAEQPSKPNLAKTFATHFPFFARLDSAVAEAKTLQGDGLLQHFSVAELRKHVLPLRFLEGHAGVELDEGAKQEQVERGRIAEKLITVRREPCGPLLKRYVDWLNSQKMSARTVRLYLTAASQLCQTEVLAENQPCREDQLQRFLQKHRGARASLFRWVTFCRTGLGWDIKMPAMSSRKSGPPRMVRDLASLLAKIDATGLEHAPVAVLQRAVAKAFGFPAKRMNILAWTLLTKGDELYLSDATDTLRVPTSMQALVATWVRRAAP